MERFEFIRRDQKVGWLPKTLGFDDAGLGVRYRNTHDYN